MKILFITSNPVGDMVLTTGVLHWLVEHYPDASLTIACGPSSADLLRCVPRLERLLILTKKKWKLHWVQLWKSCITTRWDLIVDFRNTVVSRLLFAKKRAIHGWGRNMDHRVVDNARVLNLSIAPAPYIWIDSNALLKSKILLPQHKLKPILALCPTAGWALKQWPIERFIVLVHQLIKEGGLMEGATVMVCCAAHERSIVTPLLAALPTLQCVEIIGYDLQIVAACLQQADFFIGNDSGLMHVSAALGVPTVGLFGSTSAPENYAPWGAHCLAVVNAEKGLKKVAHDLNTMEGLTTEEVFNAVVQLTSVCNGSRRSEWV